MATMEMELLRPSLLLLIVALTLLCSFSHSLPLLSVSNDSTQFDAGNAGKTEVIGNVTDTAAATNSSGSFADMFDRALEKEFTENEQNEGHPFSFFVGFPPLFWWWVGGAGSRGSEVRCVFSFAVIMVSIAGNALGFYDSSRGFSPNLID
uniref:Transmembrane protein n=1 Tax=Opuntia streptacantha TaxID=393608 RepID=A0A7C9DMR9_OPUST